MKKDTIRFGLTVAILLVLYLLVVFLIPFAKTPVFWLSFGYTLAAFAVAGAAFWIAFLRHPGAKSRFYGFPIAKIGAVYWLVQLIAGLLAMALGSWIPVWLAVLVYTAALGAAAIGLIAADAVADEIHAQDDKLKKNVTVMRTLQSQVSQLDCTDPEAAAAVKKFAEELHYSDPVSSPALEEAERDLSAAVANLQSAVLDNDNPAIKQLCRTASRLLTERNRLCKLNK